MKTKVMTSLFGSGLLAIFLVSTASAQVQRTFVSGLGSDGNPCSRTAPCRTFGQAISQTNAGGEIIVLDSAGYGPFTIAQSVSVTVPPGVYAGISVFSGSGVIVNTASSDTVILRGLTINKPGQHRRRYLLQQPRNAARRELRCQRLQRWRSGRRGPGFRACGCWCSVCERLHLQG